MKGWCDALVAVPQVPAFRTAATLPGLRLRLAAPTYANENTGIADLANTAKDDINIKGRWYQCGRRP